MVGQANKIIRNYVIPSKTNAKELVDKMTQDGWKFDKPYTIQNSTKNSVAIKLTKENKTLYVDFECKSGFNGKITNECKKIIDSDYYN